MSQLSIGARMMLNQLRLPESSDNFVESTILWYGEPKGLIETIQWIGYRIFNAIKSIFEQSDWQIAVDRIKSRLLSLIDLSNLTRYSVQDKSTWISETILQEILDRQNHPDWAIRAISLNRITDNLQRGW